MLHILSSSLLLSKYFIVYCCQDKILATQQQCAIIDDVSTQAELLTLEPKYKNHYKKNEASFNQFDNQIICDGTLFDSRTSEVICKFDKLTNYCSGVFNPLNFFEVMFESLVYDMRTIRIVKETPIFEEHWYNFDSIVEWMYAVRVVEAGNIFDTHDDIILKLQNEAPQPSYPEEISVYNGFV